MNKALLLALALVAAFPVATEAQMTVDDVAVAAVTMAALPSHVNMLEATVVPVAQPYLGRG